MNWIPNDERSNHWITRSKVIRDLEPLVDMIQAGEIRPSDCIGLRSEQFRKFAETARFSMFDPLTVSSITKDVDGHTSHFGGRSTRTDWRWDYLILLNRRLKCSVPVYSDRDPVTNDRTLDRRLREAFEAFVSLCPGMVGKGWPYFSPEYMQFGFTFTNEEDAVSFTALIS